MAYRLLGLLSEADDAIQDAWLRPSRSRISGVENLSGWLTTVAAPRRAGQDRARSSNSCPSTPLGGMVRNMNIVPLGVRKVMHRLEARDADDRINGTPRAERLRAIRPEVGELLLTLALGTRATTIVEIGTSGGYSTLWLAVAARENRGRVTTFEVDPAKVEIAKTTLADAGVGDIVDLRHEDGARGLSSFAGTADLVFMDSEKEDYQPFLGVVVDALRPGGMLVADNLTSHAGDLEGFRSAALAHPRLVGLVVPIGRGELVAVKLSAPQGDER